MTDKPSNYELNDELLSAYLDGELSADERAAVETRLATDPAAQQLLHELRSVSQSVQALPTESLGRDLNEEILCRAREAGPTSRVVRGSPDPAPSPDRRSPSTPSSDTSSGDALPKIRIFHSKRSWIWASMALAAGLLIMIVQSGDESSKKLSDIAARNREAAEAQPADEAAQPSRREIGISAAPQSPAPPSETIAFDGGVHEKDDALSAPASAPAPIAGEVGGPANGNSVDLGATSSPLAAATPAMKLRKEETKTASGLGGATSLTTAQPGEAATDKLTSALQPSGRVSGSPGERQFDAEKQKAESLVTPSAQRFVIVHVVAKSESLKSGSVERLLADNKIEFVPQPTKDQPRSFGGEKLAKPAQSKSASTEKSEKVAEIHATDTEMVLVDAPQPAIESCLADLNKNSNDFLSVDVNEAPQSHDRFDGKQTLTKSLAENKTNLSRFSRGTAPLTQSDSVDLRKYFYSYDFDKKNEPVASGSRRGSLGPGASAESSVLQNANGAKKSDYKDKPPSEIRRARSIETEGIVDRTHAGPEAATKHMSQRKLKEPAEAKASNNDNWKVLFVFTSDETPAPSAAPRQPAKIK